MSAVLRLARTSCEPNNGSQKEFCCEGVCLGRRERIHEPIVWDSRAGARRSWSVPLLSSLGKPKVRNVLTNCARASTRTCGDEADRPQDAIDLRALQHRQ